MRILIVRFSVPFSPVYWNAYRVLATGEKVFLQEFKTRKAALRFKEATES